MVCASEGVCGSASRISKVCYGDGWVVQYGSVTTPRIQVWFYLSFVQNQPRIWYHRFQSSGGHFQTESLTMLLVANVFCMEQKMAVQQNTDQICLRQLKVRFCLSFDRLHMIEFI